MSAPPLVALVGIALAWPLGAASAEPVFKLAAPPVEIVTSAEKFRPFAEAVQLEVERMLGVPGAIDDPATLRALLSIRGHLAHYFGDDDRAVANAAWIRSLQTDPAGRAFAGLTTLASVAARRRHPGVAPDDARHRAAFLGEFTRQLATLPSTAPIGAMLRGQREKIAGTTEAALLAETRDVIAPAIARRGHCGLLEADQLVRVRHRLVNILPVRTETLQALDAAIAARPSP